MKLLTGSEVTLEVETEDEGVIMRLTLSGRSVDDLLDILAGDDVNWLGETFILTDVAVALKLVEA